MCTDYEKVITHCIQQYRYKDALSVLVDQAAHILGLADAERRAKFQTFTLLVYKFSPALMRQCPEDTVEAWIKMGRYLDAKKLIPALVQCNQPPDPKQVTVWGCDLVCECDPVCEYVSSTHTCRCLLPSSTWSFV